ncbi:MAG: C45 family peptidase [Bacteroidota bacterium]
MAVIIKPPVPANTEILKYERTEVEKDFYICKNNWLRKNNNGLWEMYVEGGPFERGVMNGVLTKELIYEQEKAFVTQIKKMIPSEFYLNFLKYIVAWFARDIDEHVDKEYLLEILGVSYATSSEFEFIGPAYQRILNYHAAHDIGHALQNMNMVGCTSFASWGSAAEDSSFIVGRNFDFYAGDEFAENKIVCFYKPDKGNKFMFVTWGGMIGVVSGMNEKGLTVTINAAKSDIPFGFKTPISIIAREILQYASNIDEAYKIAKSRESFVSESLLIGSAQDKKAVIIEKSINSTDMFSTENDYIICANHFQGDTFKNENLNIENIKNSASMYRYKRVAQLLAKYSKLNYFGAAEILRDQKGIDEKNIGMGNEKAVNQLIAHHSVIFDPVKLYAWVSSNPYQLGEYVGYDLKKIFDSCPGMKQNNEISVQELMIPEDTFLYSENYKKFILYKKIRDEILNNMDCDDCGDIDEATITKLIASNPRYYFVYALSGNYYLKHENYNKAVEYYKEALSKEIPTAGEINKIMNSLIECYENM